MHRLATIGYERTTPAALVSALRKARVRLLVDVRAVASSRRPGFAKTALAAHLAEAGIDYLHLRGLGTPAAGRVAARAGRHEEMRRIFAQHLQSLTARDDLEVLIEVVESGTRACLLCLEAEPEHCHRLLVAKAVGARIPLRLDHLFRSASDLCRAVTGLVGGSDGLHDSLPNLQVPLLDRCSPFRAQYRPTAPTSPTMISTTDKFPTEPTAATGINGLDDILAGGFTPDRLYLVEGVPGSGKTTLALQFLLEGARRREPVLYVTLSETEAELRSVAQSHGWSIDGVTIRELVPSEDSLRPDDQYTMFHPSEVELSETTKTILADVESLTPTRVVFDSLSELRLLAGNPLRYRRQILALKQFFSGRKCTVMLLDDMTSASHDLQVQSIAHGVIRLEQLYPEYGSERRRLIVLKFRGVRFRGGYHDFIIVKGGLMVYPRLVASEKRISPDLRKLPSGVSELDNLLGGGLEHGTSSLIVGAAGTGKSSVAAQFMSTAAERGERSAMFIFDESRHTLFSRCEGLGIPLRRHVESGLVSVQQIDPAELSPGELAYAIRQAVEVDKVSVVVIDSLNGYLNAMPGERFLIIQLHEMLSFLGQAGVATLLIGAHQGLIGSQMQTPVDASYLADAVILMRYFEVRGEVRQAISVMKKRGGAHERSIREFRLTRRGITVGEPLADFRGILTGVPVYEGSLHGGQSAGARVDPG